MLARTHTAALTLALAALALGCRGESTATPAVPRAASETQSAGATRETPPPQPSPELAPPPYTPATELGAPVEIREAERSRLVYAAPDPEAASRGRIPSGETFHVYAEREAPGCDRAWAQVAPAAWICAERSAASEVAPRALPALDDGALVPFTYARHRAHDKPSTPDIPVYRSTRAAREGEAAVDSLPAYGSYAFSRVRSRGGQQLLTTLDRKTVIGDELELFEPSEFAGVELDEAPIADGQIRAWAVRWKTMVHAAPEPTSDTLARIRYHDALVVTGEVVEVEAGEPADRLWLEVPAHGEVPGGWIRVDEIRRFVPLAPPEPVLGGQITIDVDLDEQVLSVWIEREPVFATLVSSGRLRDRTPTGLYRINAKRAYSKMSSRPGAKEPYFVEAVPWVMFFHRSYALHAAYWHDMFGHRMSHGCINLAPRDAKRVFELATPTLPPGWLVVEEHAQDPGTLVRIRRSGAETPDQRDAFDPDSGD